jgi:hypothetical protein
MSAAVLDFLRSRATHAAAKQAQRQQRAAIALARLTRQRDACARAAAACTHYDPLRARAEALADCHSWRMLAWGALANGEAERAAALRKLAMFSFRCARGVLVS